MPQNGSKTLFPFFKTEAMSPSCRNRNCFANIGTIPSYLENKFIIAKKRP